MDFHSMGAHKNMDSLKWPKQVAFISSKQRETVIREELAKEFGLG